MKIPIVIRNLHVCRMGVTNFSLPENPNRMWTSMSCGPTGLEERLAELTLQCSFQTTSGGRIVSQSGIYEMGWMIEHARMSMCNVIYGDIVEVLKRILNDVVTLRCVETSQHTHEFVVNVLCALIASLRGDTSVFNEEIDLHLRNEALVHFNEFESLRAEELERKRRMQRAEAVERELEESRVERSRAYRQMLKHRSNTTLLEGCCE